MRYSYCYAPLRLLLRLIAMLSGAMLFVCVSFASAEVKPVAPVEEKQWRKELEQMNDQEKQDFYKRRTKLKSDIMQMENEERLDFYKQLKSTRDRWENTNYIEAEPAEEEIIEEAPPENASEVDDWKTLSYEEKRRLLQNYSE